MSDPNYMHEHRPRRKDGLCKRVIGGRKQGYFHCHKPEDADVHRRFEERARAEEEEEEEDTSRG